MLTSNVGVTVQMPATRPPRRPSRRLPGAASPAPERQVSSSLLAVAAAGVASLVGAIVIIASGATGDAWGLAALHALVIGAPIATGLYAVRHRRSERFGRMLLLAALVWSLALLSDSSGSLAFSTGRVVAWLNFPVLFYLMLSFPDGRLTSRRDRLLCAAITALIAVLYIGSALVIEAYPRSSPWSNCTTGCPPNAFLLLPSEPGFIQTALIPAREMLSVVLLIGVAVSLAVRLRASPAMRQVTIAPVVAVSIVATLVLVAFIVVRRVAPDTRLAHSIALAWTLSLPAVAAAFSLGLVQRRLVISNVLTGLGGALGASLEPRQIGAALRSTIGYPRAEVLIRTAVGDGWIREDGRVADPSTVPAPGRELRVVGDESGPFAAVELDAGLDADDELIDAVVSLGEAALREAHLKAELKTSLSDLDDSRKRMALAADAERRRIERDLHDGAQQRLIALRMRLSLAEDLLRDDPAAASAAIHHIGEDVDVALTEIRALARGIYPALLADRGLADALRSAARRAPSRVDVRAAGVTRHPPEIESAVYFSCLEALQNVLKHGRGASGARVSLWQNGALEFEVADDGEGFDPARGLPRGRAAQHA